MTFASHVILHENARFLKFRLRVAQPLWTANSDRSWPTLFLTRALVAARRERSWALTSAARALERSSRGAHERSWALTSGARAQRALERSASAHMSASMWILALVALIWALVALERYSFCYFPLTIYYYTRPCTCNSRIFRPKCFLHNQESSHYLLINKFLYQPRVGQMCSRFLFMAD